MTHGQSPVRPYGSWASPLSPEALAGASLRIGEVITDRDTIYWAEGRPTEGGRGVVVTRNADGSHRDVTPTDSNVRTLVHEYGGGAWTVAGGVVFHVELTDQQVHATDASGTRQITDEAGSRFADLRCPKART